MWYEPSAAAPACLMSWLGEELPPVVMTLRVSRCSWACLSTSVICSTLVLKQAQEQRLTRNVITTGGGASPHQLIKLGRAARRERGKVPDAAVSVQKKQQTTREYVAREH